MELSNWYFNETAVSIGNIHVKNWKIQASEGTRLDVLGKDNCTVKRVTWLINIQLLSMAKWNWKEKKKHDEVDVMSRKLRRDIKMERVET